jgi:hypothetical protein
MIRLLYHCAVPFGRLFLIVLIKRLVIGKFTAMGPEEKAQPWNRFRYWLMSKVT